MPKITETRPFLANTAPGFSSGISRYLTPARVVLQWLFLGFLMFCDRLEGQSVPSLINYQGRITDRNGLPFPSGNYGIEFRLWDSPTGTNLVWGQRQNVAIQGNGLFNVLLGGTNSPGVS